MNAVGVFLQAQILEPIMYMKLLEQRALLMHAGGVSHDGRGIVLPAHGGTGKTTLSMALLSQGSTLLGDDLLFVEADTLIVHPYPRPLHIFTYNVKNLLGATIPFKYRFAVYTKNVLRFILERLLKTEFLISTRIHADELFEGEIFGSSVPIKGVGFLQREGEAMRTVVITPSNVEEIAAAIAASADLNESLEDLLATRRDLVDDFRRRELEIVSALLTSVGRLTYVNTRQLDLTELSGLRARLLESSAAVE